MIGTSHFIYGSQSSNPEFPIYSLSEVNLLVIRLLDKKKGKMNCLTKQLDSSGWWTSPMKIVQDNLVQILGETIIGQSLLTAQSNNELHNPFFLRIGGWISKKMNCLEELKFKL